jgi:PTH1 family peptidyl-tRNA hydrolase
MAIKLIVGLGNPETKYQLNRHNVGFNLVDSLSTLTDSNWKLENKFFALVAKTKIGKENIILAKPITYMNNSGKAVIALANFFKINLDEILVIHDELDLDLGVIKLKLSGGHGGHNGLRDINSKLGLDYYRLRIGIGRPSVGDVSSFVLSNPSDKEREVLTSGFIKILENIDKIIIQPDKAMQIINTN